MSLSLSFIAPSGPRTIFYDEAPDSPKESCQNQCFHSSRTFMLPWAQRWSFCGGMLGFPQLKNDGSSWWISRTIPQGYAPLDLDPTGQTWLYPTSIEGMVGKGKINSYDANGVAQYKTVEITLGYDTLLYRVYSDSFVQSFAGEFEAQILADNFIPPQLAFWQPEVLFAGGGVNEASLVRYITRYRQPTAEYLTLPQGALKYVEPPTQFDNSGNPILTPCPGSVGKIIAAQEVMYTWHQVPNVPPALDNWAGSVNAFPFDGYDRGTLLLTTIDIKPYRWFFNQRVYDITYKMKYFQPKPGLDVGLDAGGPLNNALTPPSQQPPPSPVNESFGHNHPLRYKPGTILKPDYQLLTNNGRKPPIPVLDQAPIYPESGATIFPYADFYNLFECSGPVTPPE